jgi:hypothetical protein
MSARQLWSVVTMVMFDRMPGFRLRRARWLVERLPEAPTGDLRSEMNAPSAGWRELLKSAIRASAMPTGPDRASKCARVTRGR